MILREDNIKYYEINKYENSFNDRVRLRDEDIYIYKIRQFYLYLPIRIRSPRSN
jgi:hypothetical protein